MAFIEWGAVYETGVQEMDEQHQKLVGLLSDLHEAMKSGKSMDVLATVLSNLIQYTAQHFRDEERLMVRAGYPGLAEHKIEHEDLTQSVLEFQREFQAGRSMLSMDLMSFLRAWLTDHILGTDMQFARFVAPHPKE